MASNFCILVVAIFIMAIFMATPLVSLNLLDTSRISSTQVGFLENNISPVSSPFSEVSPDIAPLLPSPGGVIPPTSSSVPTIPSNPSKNPDDMFPIGPDSAAFAPSAFSPVSASSALCFSSLHIIAVFLILGLFVSTR